MKIKHIVITGCTKGIGKALAEQFLKLGHQVSGCGRNDQRIDLLKKANPHNSLFKRVDVLNQEELNIWADESHEAFGAPDLLISNAGIINENSHFIDIEKEEFDRVIDINIKGVANTLRAFMPFMLEQKNGIIINLSSGWGRSTSPEVAPYCGTKWAIEGLTKSIAQELPHGMAAIPLSPNTVNTSMLQSCFGDDGASFSPTPDQWAETVAPWILTLTPEDNGQSLSTPV